MAHHYIDTPRTEAVDRTRFTAGDPSFSELPSFHAPAGSEDLLKAMRGNNGSRRGPTVFATPSARAPLADRRNPPAAKNEFTPLLHSAAKNRMMMMRDRGEKENAPAALATPAALKPDFKFSSPNLPEVSMMNDTSVGDSDNTPMAPVESSSAMSTPMPMLPRKGELGMGGDGGNVLTLREQEAKLEQIDKENFGLKLKIHFLEENIKKSGPEFNQTAIRENTELKTNTVMLEREIKRYRKQLNMSEKELELYRQQLMEYAEKVKRRHMDESMRDELERLQRLADERGGQIQDLKEKLESVDAREDDDDQNEKLRENIDDLESELKEKERIMDEKDDKLEELEAKLSSARGDVEEELDEKEKQVQSQADEIEELREELQRQKEERDFPENFEEQLENLQAQIDGADRDKREQLEQFESRLQTYQREKNAELEAAQRKIQSMEKSHASDIESLELRLKLAESQGDNQSALAQQAAEDAQNKLRAVHQEKDAEIESLQARLLSLEHVQDEFESCQRQLRVYEEDIRNMQAAEIRHEEARAELRRTNGEKEREVHTLRAALSDQGTATLRLEKLHSNLAERDREIATLRQTIDAQAVTVRELKDIRSTVSEKERQYSTTLEELKQAQSTISERDRLVENLRRTLKDRADELDILHRTADEPGSQIEGLHVLVRSRDNDLEGLRATISEREKSLEALQKIADERFKALEELREELADTRQNLEDEIQVLEVSLDEAEDRVANLVNEIQGSRGLKTQLDPLERKVRTFEREKTTLQARVDELEREQEINDSERISLHSTITRLRADVETARKASKAASPLRRDTSAQQQALELEINLLRQRLDDQQKTHGSQLGELKRSLKEKERIIRDMKSSTDRDLHERAQEGREEAGRLSVQIMDSEKRHGAEIKGLVKQIQFLRAKLSREELFRDDLAWQKKWFLMLVDMYDSCNKADLKLIQEMGITPDPSIRESVPSLRTVGMMAVFCIRARNCSSAWKEKRAIQDSLVKKVEAMRGRGKKQLTRY